MDIVAKLGEYMETESKICPKCQHVQNSGNECEACGVIFSRYDRYVKKQNDKKEQEGQSRKTGLFSPGRIVQVGLLVMFSSLLTYYLTAKQAHTPAGSVQEKVEQIPVKKDKETLAPDVVAVQPEVKVSKQQPVQVISHDSPIEHARKSTVLIKAPWGVLGSGFFVNENYIVKGHCHHDCGS